MLICYRTPLKSDFYTSFLSSLAVEATDHFNTSVEGVLLSVTIGNITATPTGGGACSGTVPTSRQQPHMQSAMRRRNCRSLENVDVQQQQQSLFDISVFKLQHEQIKRGADLKLLHFVLVNNALKTLQVHMHNFDDCDDCDGVEGSVEDDGGGGKWISSYIYNTFKHDSLSSIPLSPPTPMKTVKTDSSFSDQSPLVEYLEASPGGIIDDSIITSLESERVQPAASLHEEGAREEFRDMEVADGSTKDRRLLNGFAEGHGVQLGKRTRGHFEEEDGDAQRGHLIEGVGGVTLSEAKEGGGSRGEGDSKRHCKSPGVQKGLSVLNNNNPQAVLELDPLPPPVLPSSPISLLPAHFHHHHAYQSHGGEESDKGSPTPSPIDFTNVDPSIYDFDAAVLGEDSPAGVLESCTDHTSSQANCLLPCHISSTSGPSSSSGSADFSATASYSSTTHSTLHSSFSPLSSAISVSCPPSQSTLETPHVFSSLPSCPPSSVAMSSSPHQTNGDSDYINLLSSIIEPKLSVLSAESMVLTAVSSASSVVTTTTAGVKGSSCSLQALVHNGDLVLNEEISGKSTMSNGSTNSLTLSPEAGIEADDDLGCIVDMLTT